MLISQACGRQISAVGSACSVAFGSSLIRFPGPAHSFTRCQLLVKGYVVLINRAC